MPTHVIGLLKETVYNKKTNNGVKEYTLWGDYFLLEAVMRKVNPSWNGYW